MVKDASGRSLSIFLLILVASTCAVPTRDPIEERAPPQANRRASDRIPPLSAPCVRIGRIEVSKRERTLRAFCKGGAVVVMRVSLGREPAGGKSRVDDMRTPEGRYHVTGPARPSRFRLFIPIDYPSRDGRGAQPEIRRLSPVAKGHLWGETVTLCLAEP